MSGRTLLRAKRHPLVVHEQHGLLLAQLRPEPMHVRSAGLFVQRARTMLQRLRLRERYLYLPSGHPRLLGARALITQPFAIVSASDRRR